ncbi:flagellar hook-basal body complex protein FliE [Hydrogenophaga sp.]|uniref:flagellar hook-basal body complex protein FliE n=1 Tax=Hydrogenophaga sp. TaxID=1904254 RepID=UPI003F6A6C85
MNLNTVESILNRMEALQRASRGEASTSAAPATTGGVDFAAMLRDAVRGVNAQQNTAQAQAQAFQTGDRSMSIEQVMISMQQASLSFQGIVAVRNKLLEAYREISSLQV